MSADREQKTISVHAPAEVGLDSSWAEMRATLLNARKDLTSREKIASAFDQLFRAATALTVRRSGDGGAYIASPSADEDGPEKVG